MNPERLTNNKALGTFLCRIRWEIMDEHKYKPDNLTRYASEIIQYKPKLMDKVSIMVVQDRSA